MQRRTILLFFFLQLAFCQSFDEGSGTDENPEVPTVAPWPFGGPLPTLPPLILPTLPQIDLNKLLGEWPTFPPLPSFPPLPTLPPLGEWPTFPPLPTLPPFEWPTFPPLPTLPPLSGWPTFPPLPTLGPFPTWNPSNLFPTIPPPSAQCIPKLLKEAKSGGNFSEALEDFTDNSDVSGAFQFALEEADGLCTEDQVKRLTELITKNKETWKLMGEFGKTLSKDDRLKVKQMILNNDSLGISLFSMQKGLENLFNFPVSQNLSKISSQLSLIQLQLLLSPI